MAAPGAGAPAHDRRPVVFLHVGAAKSGTTYLQNVLWHNRERLRAEGVLYPGQDDAAHVRAAFDLRETFFRGGADPHLRDAWPALVAEARAWRGRVIISQELFAPALRVHVRRALDDLAFADVHVIFTVRDLARQIPAHWQEDVKNRFTTSFADFMAALRRPDWRDSRPARLFWGLQDPVDVLGRWAEHLPPGNVHLVTLPRPGAPRDLLWRRFCEAAGIGPATCDLSATFANRSLGLPETQLLLRLNEALDGETADWHFHNDEVKHFLAQEVLNRRHGTPRIGLPAEDHAWTAGRASQMTEELRARGYHVVGDLDELMVPADGGDGAAAHPDVPLWAGIADAGADVIAALLRRIADTDPGIAGLPGGEHRTPEQLDLLLAEAAALRARVDHLLDGSAPLVRRAVRTLGERHPMVGRMREAYWRLQAETGTVPEEAGADVTSADTTSTR